MAGAMNRQQFAKQLQDGLNTIFNLNHKRFPQEWTEFYEQNTSSKAYEEDVQHIGLGGANEKAEGAMVEFDSGAEGYTARYEHTTIALGFSITEEAVEDGRYGNVSSRFSKSLARSMQYTKEIRGTDVVNNGHNAAVQYQGGDGVSLYNAAHPLFNGGTLSNKLATPADLSEDSIEDACIQIEGWVDDRGIPIKVMPKKLVIPRQLKFIAERLFNTSGRVGTADNDINAMKKLNSVPDGYCINHYLTDNNGWHLITDADDGLKHFKRRGIRGGMEVDFRSGNMQFKKSERYSFGWSDWRGAFGSEGA
jgi:hypothetical protein